MISRKGTAHVYDSTASARQSSIREGVVIPCYALLIHFCILYRVIYKQDTTRINMYISYDGPFTKNVLCFFTVEEYLSCRDNCALSHNNPEIVTCYYCMHITEVPKLSNACI